MKKYAVTNPARGAAACPQAAGLRALERPKSALGATRSTSIIGLLLFACCALAPAARAQWQSVTYSLKGGWNAIYFHGDASHATPEVLFANNTEVIEVWRWNPNPTETGFQTSPLLPTPGTSDWSVWKRGAATGNTLAMLIGQSAYLVRCSGAETSTTSLQVTQKALPPRSTWVRNGANLLGFPAGVNAPSFPTYFATFPAAVAANTRIYKYAGGELGLDNPVQVFSTAGQSVDRRQAYWFEAPVVGTFYGPMEFSPSHADGFSYGRSGSLITLRVRNRTATATTITITPATSAAAPAGQPQISGPVPITRRTTEAGVTTETLIATSYNELIGPNSTVSLEFGIDRSEMTGTPGALYASLLRFTDAAGLVDVSLPATALVSSLSGLWVGDVMVSGVNNKSVARYHTCVVTRTVDGGTREVTSRAAQAGPTTLAPVSLPPGVGPLTYKWKKNDVEIAVDGTGSTLTLTATEKEESGAFGSTTVRSHPLRVLLHVDNDGTARLLSQVFLGQLAPAPHDTGLCTLESGLRSTAKASATRLVAVHMPLDRAVSSGSGSVGLGTSLVRNFSIHYKDDPTNPFVHAYHPDHDNKDARGQTLPSGVESYTITRACTFNFAETPPVGTSSLGWGASVLAGTYMETMTGLHHQPITVTGTFQLRRVSEIGTITLN